MSKKYNLDLGQSECIFGFALHLHKYCYTQRFSGSYFNFEVYILCFFSFKKHILILIVYIATVPLLKSLVCTDWSAPAGLSRHHKPN